ncbi:MAG TPA: class I SAM-dependent methyltransferase [Bacteroidales bacterium]|nr:class I SAM-dependent methyltransferase [Bacteroidales bacterium]HOK75315.1 class I SAM-dependent methyltransferase [Bacteroidales bacterium]HOM40773.1 class I SAM-dependent methyltransferase [Bacteroidales bacterium]HOU29779.1 class I SAM-dependent methyltransferase [Bacteroidales bacterium]HPP92470.1 class I SAM-dependent methyltransferase [Bacteroidales bacterium]
MNDFHIVINNLKYKVFSRHKRGHGIHSPFVFNLITHVFRNKIDPTVVSTIENIRKEMLADPSFVKVTDYGSGSKHFRDGMRKVSSIAKYSSVPKKYGELLHKFAAEYGGTDIIEMGTSLGISALYLATGARGTMVHTIEGCPVVSEIAKRNFEKAGCRNIRVYTGKFDEVLPELKEKNIRPGLVFIDGDHRKDALLKYFETICSMCNDKSVVIIDDIHRSVEMAEGWAEIKKMKNVSVTIDICRMGIVFLRKGISKFDYVIRY